MDKLRTPILALAMIVLIGGLSYGLFLGLKEFALAISKLNPELTAATLGSLATVLGGMTGIILNQRSLSKREIAETQRAQKIKVYKNFMEDIIMKTLKHSSQDDLEEFVEEELQDTFYDFTGDLIAWGSSGFINAYEKFREAGQEDVENPEVILLYLDDALRAMRKDLGHSDWTIQRGELIKLFLTDPEKVEEINESKS